MLGPRFEPWVFMVMPPGGFLTLGILLCSPRWPTMHARVQRRRARGGRMSNLAWIFVSTMLVNNFTLVMFLGLCSFFGVTAKIETAWRLGLANTFVLLITAVSAWILNTYVLHATPVPAHHRLHRRDRLGGADRRDGGEEILARALPPARASTCR